MSNRLPRSWAYLLALLLFAALWFGTLGYRKLITPDEGRYAELAREMLVSGDWLTPRLNGVKYFEKPPLQYWATAVSYTVFGENEFAARLWPGLAGFIAVLAVFLTCRRLYRQQEDGESIAWSAAALLGSCAWWVGNGHFVTLDMGVSACLTLALCAFLWAQQDDASDTEGRNGMLLAWACMALATLSKGLIGLVIPGAVLVAYSLWMRDLSLWKRLHLGKGLLLFFAISAPWFVLVSRANPEFAYFFFIHEHFLRYATKGAQRVQPWYFFAPILIAGMLPWTAMLPGALWRGWQQVPRQGFQTNRFLFTWAIFVFAFFSASGSKLPSYILPMFPALIMLIAPDIPDLSKDKRRALLATLFVVASLLLIGSSGVFNRGDTTAADIAYRQCLSLAGIAMLVMAIIATGWHVLGRQLPFVLTLALTGLLVNQIPMLGHDVFAERKSSAALAQAVLPQVPAASTWYVIGGYDQTLPFYLKRTLQFVDYQDEFTLGQTVEPDKLIHLRDFLERWQSDAFPVAVLTLDAYKKLDNAGLSMQILYSDEERRVVRKVML